MSRVYCGGSGTWVSGQPPCCVTWNAHFCDLNPGHAEPHRCSCGSTLASEKVSAP